MSAGSELAREMPQMAAELEAHRRKELRKAIEQRKAAHDLVVYFDDCNLDALLTATRNSLEVLKKNISTNTVVCSGKLLFMTSDENVIKCHLSVYLLLLTVHDVR